MFFYARSDTHFLLYVYDMMRNELVERSKVAPGPGAKCDVQNRIEWVLQKSKETSLLRFEASLYDETGQGSRGWFNPLSKLTYNLSGEQFAVYKAVHEWRDRLARKMDESTGYLMPQNVLLDIAKSLPTDAKGVYRLYFNVPAVLKTMMNDLLATVAAARKLGGPALKDYFYEFYNAVRKQSPKSDQSPQPGLEEDETTDVKQLRSGVSQLWGPIAMSSIHDASGASKVRLDGQPIAIPTNPPNRAHDAATIQPEAPKSAESKRKGSAAESKEGGHRSPSSQLARETEDQEFTLLSKKIRQHMTDSKKEKRLAKKAAAEAAAAVSAAEQAGDFMALDGGDDDEAFDYDAAPSVLHSKRAKGGAGGFNPYTSKGNAEGPKAERRRHGEKAGKSQTFKR